MKVLVDENIDRDFPPLIGDHDVLHVLAMGWGGIKNGELMRLVEANHFGAFVTADKNMPYQQRLIGREFSLVVLEIHPNVLDNQLACIHDLIMVLDSAQPGTVYRIDRPRSRQR